MSGVAQRGATLVEVGIAVLVISVATLGLARAQLEARASGFSALQRAHAVAAGESALEIARSAGAVAVAQAWSRNDAPAPPFPDCGVQPCGRAEWVEWMLWRWWRDLGGASVSDLDGVSVGGLLAARACLVGSDSELRVEMRWRNAGSGAAAGSGCGNPPAVGWQALSLTSRIAGGGA